MRHNFDTLLKTLPAVAAAIGAKLAFTAFGWQEIELNALYSSLIAANVFLLGFLLAGVLTDYKESEKLPTDIAVRIETIADECEILFADKRAGEARELFDLLESIAAQLDDWLYGRAGVSDVLVAIRAMNGPFQRFEPLTQPNFIVRLKQEQSALRAAVLRIDTIRETSFVGAGYLVAVVTSALMVIALLIADLAPTGAELFLIGTIAFLLTYMIFLIRDLDNPFDYRSERDSAAEVSLQPIKSLRRRLESRQAAFA